MIYFATSGKMYLVSFQASNVFALVWLAVYGQMKIYSAYEQCNYIFFILLIKIYIYLCKKDQTSTGMDLSSLLPILFYEDAVLYCLLILASECLLFV